MIENLNLKNGKGASFGLFLMVVIYIFTAFLGQTFLQALGIQQDGSIYIAVNGCFSAFSIAVVLFIYLKTSKTPLKEFLRPQKFTILYLIYALLLATGMLLGLGFINELIAELFTSLNLNLPTMAIPLDSPINLVVFSIVFAVLPAIFEELFFRKYLLEQTSSLGAISSLTLVSIAFALYHFSFAQLVYQLIYGGFLFYLTKKTGSVYPAMLSHFFNNFVIILFQYLSFTINLKNPLIILVGLVCLGAFILLTSKVKNVERVKKSATVGEFILPFGLATAIICVFTAIMGVL